MMYAAVCCVVVETHWFRYGMQRLEHLFKVCEATATQ